MTKAHELTADKNTDLEKLRSIFTFVRDGINFGFPTKWDSVKASETLHLKMGYCNTKATLFLALCQASNIKAKIHTGLIDLQIMRGIFPSFAFPFLPSAGGHSWIDVYISNEWKSLDSYINDKRFFDGAMKKLLNSGETTAFSISLATGKSSCEFNFGDLGYVHMGAVLEDHGTWEDFAAYMASTKYVHMNKMQLMAYPLMAKISNRTIEKIRL
jgi:hypothetical protein